MGTISSILSAIFPPHCVSFQQGKLESQLTRLYKQLLHVQNSLPTILPKDDSRGIITEAPHALHDHLHDHVTRSCDLIREATQQLLSLSLLVPAAPWVSIC